MRKIMEALAVGAAGVAMFVAFLALVITPVPRIPVLWFFGAGLVLPVIGYGVAVVRPYVRAWLGR